MLKPQYLTPQQLCDLSNEYGGYRAAVAALGCEWSGSWGRAFKAACGEAALFENTGAEFVRFDNELDTEALHEWYLERTDRREYALDIDINLPSSTEYYNCVLSGDVHLGPLECAYGEWYDLCKWTLADESRGMIFQGDGLNLNTKDAPSSPAQDRLTFPQQVELLTYNLRPLADAGRLHMMLRGNHDDRIRRATGVDECPIRHVAKDLGVPYGGYEQFVRWRVRAGDREQMYIGYHHHGRGAARTPGGVLNSLIQMAQMVSSDYVAAGHTHRLFSHWFTWREVAADGEIVVRKIPVVNTGSYQRTQGETYSTRNAFSPAVIGAASIHLYTSKHSVHART